MNRWLFLLLLAAPAAVLARALDAPPLVTFVLAALGIVPLAGLIGQSTEVLAERFGQSIGGLLNATFGNAAEIIIGLTALAAGLPEVVQASIAGSIIGNVLLVLGTAMLVGGWRYRRQQFQPRVAGQYAAMQRRQKEKRSSSGREKKEILLRYWPDGGEQRSGSHSLRWLALQQLPR